MWRWVSVAQPVMAKGWNDTNGHIYNYAVRFFNWKDFHIYIIFYYNEEAAGIENDVKRKYNP